MPVIANLVIGQDGSTSVNGTSAKLSSPADRKRFHSLREQADVILIGGRTARLEPYQTTPKPLVVVSRQKIINEISSNKSAVIINSEPESALRIAQSKFGSSVLVECGPNLLLELIHLVDILYITISKQSGDGQQVSFDGLTRDFVMENMEKIDGEIFYEFRRAR
jgi:riboflavin biosynthesis pyrimidine reductase